MGLTDSWYAERSTLVGRSASLVRSSLAVLVVCCISSCTTVEQASDGSPTSSTTSPSQPSQSSTSASLAGPSAVTDQDMTGMGTVLSVGEQAIVNLPSSTGTWKAGVTVTAFKVASDEDLKALEEDNSDGTLYNIRFTTTLLESSTAGPKAHSVAPNLIFPDGGPEHSGKVMVTSVGSCAITSETLTKVGDTVETCYVYKIKGPLIERAVLAIKPGLPFVYWKNT